MSGPETADSPQVKLVRGVVEGMRTKSVDLLYKQLHKDLRRIIHPRSLGIPDRNKEEYLQHITEFFAVWTEDCEASTLVFWTLFLPN